MSFNVQQPYGTHWETRQDSAAKLIALVNADLIGTQEAINSQRNFLIEQAKIYNYFGCGRDGGDNGEGSWIFYKKDKFKVDSTHSGNFWLSNTPDVPSRFGGDYNRLCTYVHLTDLKSGKTFYHFNVHFPIPELDSARMVSMKFLASQIAKIVPANEPYLLTGDFNSPEEDTATIWMKTAADNPIKVIDSYRQVHPTGFVTTGFGCRLDYIYFKNSGQFKTIASWVVEHPAGASDHFPIAADITITFDKK
jgi:endonuclease/exonuclease/phosphatase family metal-dependent hydrolase